MAGRPVASRGGGLTGLHYGLITFVILTVLMLVLFVLQLTKNSDLVTAAERANKKAQEFGEPAAWYVEEAGRRSTSVSAVMDDERRALAKLIAGTPDAFAAAVAADAAGRLKEIAARHNVDGRTIINETATLLTALESLSDALSAARQAERAASEAADVLKRDKESLVQQADARDKEFRSQVDDLNKRVGAAEEEKTRQLAEKDRQLADVQAALEAANQELQQLRTEVVRGEREKDLIIARLEKQVDALRQELQVVKPSTFDAESILTKSDGRVLRAIPGSEIVYISLGARDKIKVGMGFEVYSQTREAKDNLRGKASIEVLTVMNDTAECRVSRVSPGQPIVEGDFVVNVAYEKSRKPRFVVAGDFDLDYNGVVDFEGGEKIKAIIREWGGQVAENLDESTDYVVIGLAPQVPPLSGDNVSAVVRALAEDKEIEKSKFRDLVNEARSMYIPVMTQNAFLVLTGYAGTGSATVR